LHSKSQHTAVKHSRQLLEHTYTSDPQGLGTPTPIEFFQQDLLWESSITRSHSCSRKASKHTRSIRRRAMGPLAHRNGTSAHSPLLACHLPAPTIECLHRPPYKLTGFSCTQPSAVSLPLAHSASTSTVKRGGVIGDSDTPSSFSVPGPPRYSLFSPERQEFWCTVSHLWAWVRIPLLTPDVTFSWVLFHDGTLLHSKSQYTTVKHSRQLL
jgi:hypothetical protein